MPDGQDQPRLLGQRNEVQRLHLPALRVFPAHQGLHTQTAALGVHLGLVVQHQLVAVYGLAQVRFQCGAGIEARLDRRIEKPHRVAPGSLGLVHGQIGALENLINAQRMAQEHGHPHAGTALVLHRTDGAGL